MGCFPDFWTIKSPGCFCWCDFLEVCWHSSNASRVVWVSWRRFGWQMLGPWDVVAQEQLEKLVVGGWTLINDLKARFCKNLPTQNVPSNIKVLLRMFWLFKQKENFFRDALWKDRAPAKGLKRPGENPLTSHLHPQNLTLIPKLMGFGRLQIWQTFRYLS